MDAGGGFQVMTLNADRSDRSANYTIIVYEPDPHEAELLARQKGYLRFGQEIVDAYPVAENRFLNMRPGDVRRLD